MFKCIGIRKEMSTIYKAIIIMMTIDFKLGKES